MHILHMDNRPWNNMKFLLFGFFVDVLEAGCLDFCCCLVLLGFF